MLFNLMAIATYEKNITATVGVSNVAKKNIKPLLAEKVIWNVKKF